MTTVYVVTSGQYDDDYAVELVTLDEGIAHRWADALDYVGKYGQVETFETTTEGPPPPVKHYHASHDKPTPWAIGLAFSTRPVHVWPAPGEKVAPYDRGRWRVDGYDLDEVRAAAAEVSARVAATDCLPQVDQ